MGHVGKKWLTTEEAAAYTGLSKSTLARNRWKKTGCKYRKLHGRVLYDVADLDAWIQAEGTDVFLDALGRERGPSGT